MPIKQTTATNLVVELNTENSDLDYENLRTLALELVQKYSGKIWTDYNLHDPGVTIIEALCFALTDLVYKTNFSIQDILSNTDGSIDFKDQSFYTIDEILATNPTNLTDLKKVFLDKIEEIQYISFLKTSSNIQFSIDKGVYDVQIQLKPAIIEQIKSLKEESEVENFYNNLKGKIKFHFNHNRFLGVDIQNIYFSKPIEVNIQANISISKDVDAEEILAKIYYHISNYFTYILKFDSPVDLYNSNIDLVDIYDGPSLTKGVIKNDFFQEQIIEANENDIITLIKTIPGIKEVLNFSFIGVENKSKLFTIKLNDNEYFTINHLSKGNKVKFFIEERELKINYVFFDSLFNELISSNKVLKNNEIAEITNKNTYGNYRSIETYHTIQNHFPIIYGLGLEGISSSEGEPRIAYLRQLKAFLALFEQIMANYVSQLNATNYLFSNKLFGPHAKTYFSQPIHQITGLKDILIFFNDINKDENQSISENNAINKLLQALNTIAENDAIFNDRKNAFFNHLLARFNIALNSLPVDLFEQVYATKKISRITNKLIWKSEILQNILNITKNRLRAPSYFFYDDNYDFLSIVYKLLYIQQKPFSSLVNHLDNGNQKIEIQSANEFTVSDNIKHVLIEDIIPVLDNDSLIQMKKNETNEDFIVFEFQNQFMFQDGCNKKNFKVIPDVFGIDQFLILFKSRNDQNWKVIGRYKEEKTAIDKVNEIIKYFIDFNIKSEGIHMIENLLLRPHENAAIYGFKIINNYTKNVLIKGKGYTNKIENNNRILNFKNNLSTISISDDFEKFDTILGDYIFIDDTLSQREKIDILFDIKAYFNNEPSQNKLEITVHIGDEKEIDINFFDFKINFILPSWPARFQDSKFKHLIEQTITEYLPAHLIPTFSFLDLEKMVAFENIYFDWINNSNDKSNELYTNASLSITKFLNNL